MQALTTAVDLSHSVTGICRHRSSSKAVKH